MVSERLLAERLSKKKKITFLQEVSPELSPAFPPTFKLWGCWYERDQV